MSSPREIGLAQDPGHGLWIGNEIASPDLAGNTVSPPDIHSLQSDSMSQSASAAASNDEEELETRELS